MATRLMINLRHVEADEGLEKLHIFHDSPITVGSGSSSALRLNDSGLSPRQGLLFFTSREIKYLDCSPTKATPSGRPALLGPNFTSPVIIGRFEVSGCLHEARQETDGDRSGAPPGAVVATFGDELARLLTPVESTARAFSEEHRRDFVDFAWRAIDVLRIASVAVAELRRREIDPSTIRLFRKSWDPLEVVDYLLDPTGSTLRLDELRRHFIDLVHLEASVLAPTVQA